MGLACWAQLFLNNNEKNKTIFFFALQVLIQRSPMLGFQLNRLGRYICIVLCLSIICLNLILWVIYICGKTMNIFGGPCVCCCRYQGLSVEGNPKVFEHFVSQHRCNYYCGLLSLRSLKAMDSLLSTPKPKASKSPLLQRKVAANSSSPQAGRRAASSPKLPRKTEQEERKTKNCS